MTTYILDTSGFMHRAYHASKGTPMYTKEGAPVAAIDLFRRMLTKLRYDQQADRLLAACDSEVYGFRWKLYPEYKAGRPATPEDFAAQRPGMYKVLEEMGIPAYVADGYEADDVIGTLAEKETPPVCIISGDKDLCQLVRPGVTVLNPSKNVMLDCAGVEKAFGVPPNQLVDLLALEGDSSDNVPGAPGVGPKGALEIIRKFGTVENALDHTDQITNRRYRKALQENRALILLSKQLVTICRNIP